MITPTPPAMRPLPYGLTVEQIAAFDTDDLARIMAALQARGRCRSHDPELFFPEPGAGEPAIEEARRVCRTCPFRAACLTYALATDTEVGVWGGYSKNQRAGWLRAVVARREQIAKEAKKATAAEAAA